MKIFELFSYPPLPNIPKTRIPSDETKYTVVIPENKIGIEVEVENVRHIASFEGTVWNVIEDGSLRNNGREFVSLPIEAKHAEACLKQLFSKLPENRSFSKRTSVHIHVNVRDMTLEEIQNMTYLYLVFEKSIFNFVGENRHKNIHCVPLLGTTLITSMLKSNGLFKEHMEMAWMKYCAYNLAPTTDGTRGTVEFRHMHGTDDIDKLMTWINIILSIKNYVMTTDSTLLHLEINALNTNSEYRRYTEKVFGLLAQHLLQERYEQGMERGVTQVKLLLGAQKFMRELKNSYGKRIKPEVNNAYSGTQNLTDLFGILNTFAPPPPPIQDDEEFQ